MGTIAEQLKKEGRQEGWQKGRAHLLVQLVRAGRLGADAARQTLDSMVAEGQVTDQQAAETRAQIAEAERS